jgi:hypothetical protein
VPERHVGAAVESPDAFQEAIRTSPAESTPTADRNPAQSPGSLAFSEGEGSLGPISVPVAWYPRLVHGTSTEGARSDEVESSESARLGDGERQRAYRASQRIPLDLYGEVFNPTLVPPEEPVIGSIADDLADIYREIAAGLRAYEQGNHAAAAWEWTFGLHSHWGAHATSAIRALHWWLAENAIDRLSSGRRAG